MRRKVAEFGALRCPEECLEVAEEGLKLMESDNPADRVKAQAILDASACIGRVWEFYWPPEAYVLLIFIDPTAAERATEIFNAFGLKAKKVARRLGSVVLPAVKIDCEAYYRARKSFGQKLSPLDEKMNAIVQRYLAEKSKKKALRMLDEETAKLMRGE